jgi:hypothetical protein
MSDTDYQIACDPNAKVFGTDGVLHITVVGDCAPLCGNEDLTLVNWSEPLDDHLAGATLVSPDFPICGKCADKFWKI